MPRSAISLAARLGLACLGVALPVLAGPSPPPVASFDGLDRAEASHQGLSTFPPDTRVASSGERVVEVAGSAVRLSNRDGSGAVVRSLNDFFGEPGGPLLLQAQVVYDRIWFRFYVAALAFDLEDRRSTLYFAASFRDDPEDLEPGQSWCVYQLDGRRGPSYAAALGLGGNEHWLTLTTDQLRFNNGRFKEAILHAVDKTRLSLVTGDGECLQPERFAFRLGRDAGGSKALGVRPAEHLTSNRLEGRPALFLSTEAGSGGSDLYTLWRLSGSPGRQPSLSRVGLRGDPYEPPPPAPQKGGLELDTGGTGVRQAVFRSGRLWAVHTTGCNLGGGAAESCVHLVEIRPGDDGDELTSQQTLGRKGWHYWMPGVAANERGDLVVPFLQSRPNRFLSFAYAGRRADAGSFDRVRTLERGRCALENVDGEGFNRTGGSVGAGADPLDDHGFWIAGEAAGDVATFGCDWRTEIALVRSAPPAPGPRQRLGGGEVDLPAALDFEDPGFHEAITFSGSLPASLGATAGRRLVLALLDTSRPGLTVECDHPTGGCATVDYSAGPRRTGDPPSGIYENRLSFEVASGSRDFFLSQSLDLADAADPLVPS